MARNAANLATEAENEKPRMRRFGEPTSQVSDSDPARELPSGYYTVKREPRTECSHDEALARIKARSPGAIIGARRHCASHWGWQVQTRPLPSQRGGE